MPHKSSSNLQSIKEHLMPKKLLTFWKNDHSITSENLHQKYFFLSNLFIKIIYFKIIKWKQTMTINLSMLWGTYNISCKMFMETINWKWSSNSENPLNLLKETKSFSTYLKNHTNIWLWWMPIDKWRKNPTYVLHRWQLLSSFNGSNKICIPWASYAKWKKIQSTSWTLTLINRK